MWNRNSLVSPESLGIPSSSLRRLLGELDKLDAVNSLSVARHGKLCLESYWRPYSAETPHTLFSLSKSFLSAAVGLAIQEGKIGLTAPLCGYFPEYSSCIVDPRMRDVTIRDLLTMRSGHANCQVARCVADPDGDWVRGFLSSRLAYAPGTTFVYNSAASYMISAALRRATGENAREYLMPRLFEPLEIVPGAWESCPAGTNFGGWGLSLKTADIAKFAQLLLDGGRWEGKSLLPEDYLLEATSPQADNTNNSNPDWRCGYGYHFWVSRHGCRGDGANGQFALMLKQEDMSIAVTSCVDNMQRILDRIWDFLLPDLHDEPLPESPAELAALREFAAGLSIPVVSGAVGRRSGNRVFRFAPNPAGVTKLAVEFGGGECALNFYTAHGMEQLRAGLGGYRFCTFKLHDVSAHPRAASAAWTADEVLTLHMLTLDGTFRDTWEIDFRRGAAQPVRCTSRNSTFRPAFPQLTVE